MPSMGSQPSASSFSDTLKVALLGVPFLRPPVFGEPEGRPAFVAIPIAGPHPGTHGLEKQRYGAVVARGPETMTPPVPLNAFCGILVTGEPTEFSRHFGNLRGGGHFDDKG